MVVFRSGESALQVLPPLVDVIPEARLNLVIYYLKQVKFGRILPVEKHMLYLTQMNYVSISPDLLTQG